MEIENFLWSDINWKNKKGEIWYPNIVKIDTIKDGSCFFHAIVNSFFRPYREEIINGKHFDRQNFVKNFRNDLAMRLEEKNESNGKSLYEVLSRGELPKMTEQGMDDYSLENLKKKLTSGRSVGNEFHELISEVLKRDIYFLDNNKENVYITGKDEDILYKDRDSTVLLYLQNETHYELIGIEQEKGEIITSFSPGSDFIKHIRKIMNVNNK
uniref:OTU-like cysteine protease n=1 Tax=Pithovirus LCPAC104 TaxID=2506589 RepID=A0A481Z6E4_9VIRU|nr:MAG: OTU-like cysteine protease [Pithovirus LCPAC104]